MAIEVTSAGLATAVARFDASVDEAWGNALRGRRLADRAFYLASEMGDFSLIWLMIASAQGLRSDEDAQAALRATALLLAESALVNQGIKRLVRRPRPEVVGVRPHHLRTPATSSFPSGHASAAFAAAAILSGHHPRRAPAFYALAALVATSRIHVQIHHASDVVVGAAVGAGFARLTRRVWQLPNPRQAAAPARPV